jgi:aryl-alcohol dehydrogenase-like predicted oxidoreductase
MRASVRSGRATITSDSLLAGSNGPGIHNRETEQNKMERRRIGSLQVSVVGLGCNNFGWRIGKEETREVLAASIDAGVNFLDTADMYATGESEEFMGEALAGRRGDVLIATKFGFSMGEGKSGAKPAYVKQACDASLKRLKTDRIDLYQLHTPDPSTPIGDTLAALGVLVKAGKVREIGCSNFSVDQLREAEAAVKSGAARFVSVQNHYSLFHREPEDNGVLAECSRTGVAFIPYFPLANGLLSGKYRKGQPLPENSRGKDAWGPNMFSEANLDKVEALVAYAKSKGHSLLELAISWLAAQEAVASVIAGARNVEQAKVNAGGANWKMTADDLGAISRIVA